MQLHLAVGKIKIYIAMIQKKRMDVNKMDYIYKELNQRKENLVSLIEYVKTLTDKELEDIFDNETINRNI